MAAPVNFQNLLPDASNTGVSISSSTSELVVLNKDAKTITQVPDDPWYLAAGSDAAGANVVRIPTQFATYLDLFHAWDVPAGAGVEDPTTQPVVKVYGRLRQTASGSEDRLTPYELSATFWPNLSTYWRILNDPSPPTGAANDYELAFEAATAFYHFADGLHEFRIAPPRKVFLAGCEEVMVVIKTAAAGHDGRSLILGHLIR